MMDPGGPTKKQTEDRAGQPMLTGLGWCVFGNPRERLNCPAERQPEHQRYQGDAKYRPHTDGNQLVGRVALMLCGPPTNPRRS
jgi:hypothetical protein